MNPYFLIGVLRRRLGGGGGGGGGPFGGLRHFLRGRSSPLWSTVAWLIVACTAIIVILMEKSW